MLEDARAQHLTQTRGAGETGPLRGDAAAVFSPPAASHGEHYGPFGKLTEVVSNKNVYREEDTLLTLV